MYCSSKHKMERKNNDFSTNPPNFVDCSETMNVEESVNDPLAIQQND